MSMKHFVSGSLATTAMTAAVVLAQGMFGTAPDETRYLPTVNSAMAMRVVGASEGMKETGWKNAPLENRVAALEDRVLPELKKRFDHIRRAAHDEAVAGGWNETALEQYIGASLVTTNSLMDMNSGVFEAENDAERLRAKVEIFEQYMDGSPYVGVAVIQMGELTAQLQGKMQDRGMLEFSQADPGAALNPNFQRNFHEVLESLSFEGPAPLSRARGLEAALDPFTAPPALVPLPTPDDPISFSLRTGDVADQENAGSEKISVSFAF